MATIGNDGCTANCRIGRAINERVAGFRDLEREGRALPLHYEVTEADEPIGSRIEH
jgi:hypothetical protein